MQSSLKTILYQMQVLTAKELIQLTRDVMLMIFVVWGFTMDIFVAGSGLKIELEDASYVVSDLDQSPSSRELIYRFKQPEFRLDGVEDNDAKLMSMLDHGTTMLVLSIPPKFGSDLAKGHNTSVQLLVDTTNSVLGSLAAGYAGQLVIEFAMSKAMEKMRMFTGSGRSMPGVDSAHIMWFNPNGVDKWFVPVTELMTMITMLSILLPAAAMVREKERGTVEQLLVSPLNPLQIMFPKVIAMTAVILVGVTISIFGVLQPIFHVPFRGSYVLFYVLTAIYVFSSAGFGLVISTITRNLAQVGLVVIMFLAPMLLLSGTWIPSEALPEVIQWLMLISPLHYFINVVFGIMLKGVGLSVLWESVLGLVVLGTAVFTFGLLRFRRQFAI